MNQIDSDIYQTLKRAYAIEFAATQGKPSTVSIETVSNGGNADWDRVTLKDKVIWSAGIRTIVSKMDERNRLIIDAYFTHMSDDYLCQRKMNSCWQLRKRVKCRGGQWFVYDSIRDWAGGSGFCQHSLEWWAEHLGKSRRVLQSQLSGTRTKKGLYQQLDEMLELALAAVTSVIDECGGDYE